MKRLATIAMFAAAVAAAQSLSAAVDRIPLRDGWRFFRAALSTDEHDFTFDRMSAWLDGKNAPARMPGKNHHCVKPDCDDSLWREVTVPHDWGIERTFDAMQNDIYEANLDMTGVGWYRMKFNVEGAKLAVGGKQAEVAPGGKVYFACDGAASFAMAWINGRFVGGWPYQYTSWRVDLTPHLKDGENVLAVRTEQYSAANRWYGGAGLYRECCLEVCPRDHLVADSVFITTPVVEKDRAVVRVQYEMSESGRKEYSFEVKNPRLWDIDDPHLYTLSLEGETFRYGIRKFSCHADERGFQLNGRRVQLRGMCLHNSASAKKPPCGGLVVFIICALKHNRRETITTRIRTAIKPLVTHVGVCFTRTASICIRIRTTITCDNRCILLRVNTFTAKAGFLSFYAGLSNQLQK